MGKKKVVARRKKSVMVDDETTVLEDEEETPWWKVHNYDDSKHRDWRCLACGRTIEKMFLTTPSKLHLCRGCGRTQLEGRKRVLVKEGEEELGKGERRQVAKALSTINKSLEVVDNVNRIKTG